MSSLTLPGLMRFTRSVLGRTQINLQDLLHGFQQVLENNDRALEKITDLGEKLSGSYIFDMIYLKDAYAKLAGSVKDSIKEFMVLTDSQYPIDAAFDRIHLLINRILHDDALGGGDLILANTDITWEKSREVGGKNYHLSELRNRLNLKTPDGFSITNHAFDEYIRHNGLTESLSRLQTDHSGSGAADRIREKILAGQIPEALTRSVADALERLTGGQGENVRLAMRSSAEEEDDFHSFTGQFKTVLNVPL